MSDLSTRRESTSVVDVVSRVDGATTTTTFHRESGQAESSSGGMHNGKENDRQFGAPETPYVQSPSVTHSSSRVAVGSPVQTHGSGIEGNIGQSDSNGGSAIMSPQRTQSAATFAHTRRHSSFGSMDGSQYHSPTSYVGEFRRPVAQSPMGPPLTRSDSLSSNTPSAAANHIQTGYGGASASMNNLISQPAFPRMSPLPPNGFSAPGHSQSVSEQQALVTTVNNSLSHYDSVSGTITSGSFANDVDMMAPYSFPVFGGEGYGNNRSPFAMGDDFTAWLFSESNINSRSPHATNSGTVSNQSTHFQGQYYSHDPSISNLYVPNMPLQDPMSVTSILDGASERSIISEEKRQELLDYIVDRFNETEHAGVKDRKQMIIQGNRDEPGHILSLRMMETYIGSFWYHVHAQMPILHKPTFGADKTPTLLLLTIVAFGASALDKMHGKKITDAASELGIFLAWHIRWAIFQDADFSPPAKLWVFQTLILLEMYEKMYSTRALHERAHIHHDTTLTLMRRGSSLTGRSALDSPSSHSDGHSRSSTSAAPDSGSADEWWSTWIRNEATRRAAFAAFVIDSTHATMFGHSAKMVAHEMRLPLPCDEGLWSATSGAEVARIQASLSSNGIKQITFLEGLKCTLNGSNVRTNSFGRSILMAGLLSVSWHMNQRDLQVSSLGVTHALGGRDKWRSALNKAFDYWKRDFDEVLAENPADLTTPYRFSFKVDEENIFESRIVLHHLAHMASHVDIVDCQIFAGANRLLGRAITPKDLADAQTKMTKNWAPKASARDATYYALKFLAKVLIPDDNVGRPSPSASEAGSGSLSTASYYSARDDYLLNRPWVLYFAALIVWCYGYALEGPIPAPLPDLSTGLQQARAMREFLETIGAVHAPDDLEHLRGRNRSLGMLMILRDAFAKTRWELLHEASSLLGNCVEMLKGSWTVRGMDRV